MERPVRTTPSVASGLLKRQMASISDILRRGAQGPNRGMQPTVPLQLASSPTLTAESSTAKTTSARALDDQHNGLEQLYSRLVHSAAAQRRSASTGIDCAALVPPVSLRGGLESDIEDDDPETLLASIGGRQEPPISRADGLRVTLANRDRALSSGIGLTSDERDLDALHRRLTDSSQASQHADTGSATSDLMGLMPAGEDAPGTAWREGATSLPRKVIAHMIALLLENADCGWEVVKGWTTYLYSSGLDGHSAQAAKEAMVKRATEELANIIQGIGEIETECEKRDEKERLSCRLNVSNLAAGAEEEDVRDFFLLHDYDIREIKVLTVRDPSRRTRTAQLDMWTRNAAVRASFLHGSIFGLKLIIELAVGIDD